MVKTPPIITNHKVGVSFDVVGNVATENEVPNSVGGDSPVVGVVNGAVLDVGPIHRVTQVEVDGVSTQSEGLASISKLCMLNPNYEKKKIPFYCFYFSLTINPYSPDFFPVYRTWLASIRDK